MRPCGVIEDQRTVGEVRGDRVAQVLVTVGQFEPEFRSRPEIYRVESFEPRAGDDAVRGGVFQAVFESDADLRGRREDDLPVLRREAVAVVVESADCLAVRIDALRRGRFDDVPHRVGYRLGIGRDPSQFVGRRRRRGQPPGRESHAVGRRRGVARGVGSAHVERAEELRFQKAALHAVARFGEDLPDERGDVQKGVVVLHRKEPFGRKQVLRAVLLFIFVAVNGEELHGRGIRPAFEDRRRRQLSLPRHAQPGEHPAGGVFGPSGTAVADFERVARLRRGQQAHRPADQHRPFRRQFRRVERIIEPPGGMGVPGEGRHGIVSGRRRDRDFQRPPFAAGFRPGQLRRIVTGYGDALRAQIAGLSVDSQFHDVRVLRLGRTAISRQLSVL